MLTSYRASDLYPRALAIFNLVWYPRFAPALAESDYENHPPRLPCFPFRAALLAALPTPLFLRRPLRATRRITCSGGSGPSCCTRYSRGVHPTVPLWTAKGTALVVSRGGSSSGNRSGIAGCLGLLRRQLAVVWPVIAHLGELLRWPLLATWPLDLFESEARGPSRCR